jgi:hypothetical protein
MFTSTRKSRPSVFSVLALMKPDWTNAIRGSAVGLLTSGASGMTV